MGRILGTGTVHNGLYYLDEGSDEVALHPRCLHVKNYCYSIVGLDTPLLLLCERTVMSPEGGGGGVNERNYKFLLKSTG
jgi:hypothetical protein